MFQPVFGLIFLLIIIAVPGPNAVRAAENSGVTVNQIEKDLASIGGKATLAQYFSDCKPSMKAFISRSTSASLECQT